MEEENKEIIQNSEQETLEQLEGIEELDEENHRQIDNDYFSMEPKETSTIDIQSESSPVTNPPEVPLREPRNEGIFTPSKENYPIKSVKNKKQINSTLFGIIVGVIVFILVMAIFYLPELLSSKTENQGKEKTYYGESYSIKYSSPWKETTKQKTNGEEGKILSYKNKILFLPLGSTPLDATTDADFSTEDGRKQLYNEFYSYWGESDYLGEGTNDFQLLKDKIYYASMDYGSSEGKIDGKMYLVVSQERNIILSFTTQVTGNKQNADQKVMKLLKNIVISTDDEMFSYLNNMSNWNRFASIREGELGKEKSIEGEWRILDSSETYWILKDKTFTLYESYKDLNDNYISGTYEHHTGKDGLEKVGILPEKVDEIISASNGRVTEEDIYTIILKPNKKIVSGQDTTQELNTEEWQFIWILIDHGTEGIELQQLNVKNSSANYYVKAKDK